MAEWKEEVEAQKSRKITLSLLLNSPLDNFLRNVLSYTCILFLDKERRSLCDIAQSHKDHSSLRFLLRNYLPFYDFNHFIHYNACFYILNKVVQFTKQTSFVINFNLDYSP